MNWFLMTEPTPGGGETMAEIWTALSDFIIGIFGGIGDVLTGVSGEPVLLAFVVLLPLMNIGIALLMRFLGRRRASRRR